MAQKFLIVGDKAYRESHALNAVTDPNFKPGAQQEVAAIETTARINEVYVVIKHMRTEKGLKLAGKFYTYDLSGVMEGYKDGELVELKRLSVVPFLERGTGRRGVKKAA